jgi:hypothetical protein
MRDLVGIPADARAVDRVLPIILAAADIHTSSTTPGQVRAALLDAAGMIRDLRVVLNTGTEIRVRPD